MQVDLPLSLENETKIHINRTLIHRLGSIEEIDKVTTFLASDQAAFITSEILIVDVGLGAYQGFISQWLSVIISLGGCP